MDILDTIIIHRGRNKIASRILKSISTIDYNFDFRGFYRGQALINLFWLLVKAWITSKEIPEAKQYIAEGGLVFWVGFFLKRRYKQSQLLVVIPEPAFYLDKRKGRLQQLLFSLRMKAMKSTVDRFIFISKMVRDDALPWIGKIPHQVIPFYIHELSKMKRLVHKDPGKNLLFVIERPQETGYVKGLDLAIEIFEDLSAKRTDVLLRIIGSGTQNLHFKNPRIQGLGFVDLDKIFADTSICIAPARYDAFPSIIAETSLHGIIPLISNRTGSKEILWEVDPHLVIPFDEKSLWIKRIENYLDSSEQERNILYQKLKERFELLSEDRIIKEYQEATQLADSKHTPPHL